MNPLETFLAEKKAGFFSSFTDQMKKAPESMGGALAQGATTAMVGAGIAGIGVAATKIYDAMTKRRDFNAMMSANPDLMAAHEQNPNSFNLMFTSLRSMNPSFSADPLVAGSYMRRMTENPMTAGNIAVESLGHRDATRSPVSEAFSRGGLEGTKGFRPESDFQRLKEQGESRDIYARHPDLHPKNNK